MSILIKGMDVPHNCDDCHFDIDCPYDESQDGYKMMSGRPLKCPLAPVPKHGKLGDLDRLAKEVEDMGKEFPPDSIGAERYRLFAEFIKTAPTILEAEEGET